MAIYTALLYYINSHIFPSYYIQHCTCPLKRGAAKILNKSTGGYGGRLEMGRPSVSGGCLREEKMSRSHRPQYDPVTDQAMDTLHAFRNTFRYAARSRLGWLHMNLYILRMIYIYNYINYIYIYWLVEFKFQRLHAWLLDLRLQKILNVN